MSKPKMTTETLEMKTTWEGILGVLLALIRDGDHEGRKIAVKELTNMAKLADRYVKAHEEGKV